MTKAHAKRKHDIKSKLMAAVAMLLVSSIMMVSSTYAWFTLSTAPEVKGITTAVGANGNLEMALIPNIEGVFSDPTVVDFGITSGVGDGADSKTAQQKNITWGNLVDLSQGYGLDMITLYPAALTNTEVATGTGAILSVPSYGADGRVKALEPKAIGGAYDNGVFKAGGAGVRAVGVQSNVSALELAYNNAVNKATSLASSARNTAKSSMSAAGSTLASMAATHVLTPSTTYKGTDIAVMQGVVTASGTALGYVGDAIVQYVLAHNIGVSNSEEAYGKYLTAAEGLTAAQLGTTATTVTVGEGTAAVQFIVNESAAAALAALSTANGKVANAQAALDALDKTDDSYDWEEVYSVMKYLTEPSGMTLSDGTTEKAVEDLDVNSDAVFVINATHLIMKSGSGIYADIADLAGNYEAQVAITINYQGQDVSRNVTMQAQTTREVTHLVTAKNGLTAPTGGSGTTSPLSDYYGYIIDLAFRTNAAGSKLLLATEGVDRIYTGNTANQDTLGAGSTMTFESTDETFTGTQMLNLLESLKIVFFDPTTGAILANGELANAVVTGGSEPTYTLDNTNGTYKQVVTPPVYDLVENLGGNNYTGYRYDRTGTGAEGDPYVYTQAAAGAYGIKVAAKTSYVLIGADETYAGDKYTRTEGAGGNAKVDADIVLSSGSAYITDLEQNVAKAVSVLVYLDGNSVTNADVAVSGKLAGKMNLQFASDANLVPMDYSDLKSGTTTPGTAENPTIADVSVSGDVEGAAKYFDNGTIKAVVYIPDESETNITALTINGATATNGNYGTLTGWGVTVTEKPASAAIVINPTP